MDSINIDIINAHHGCSYRAKFHIQSGTKIPQFHILVIVKMNSIIKLEKTLPSVSTKDVLVSTKWKMVLPMANKPNSNFKSPTNKPKPSAASINTAVSKPQIGTVTAIKNIALINEIILTQKAVCIKILGL